MSDSDVADRRSGSVRVLVPVFLITGFATFMAGLDNLVVTIALPDIQRDLDTNVTDLSWSVNAYTITFAVFMLTAAALGDRFGRRPVFAAGIALFGAASAAAAVSPTMFVFGIARAGQGLGAAIIVPLALTLLIENVPARLRTVSFGILGGINGLAIALGPFVGGWIVQTVGWHAVFWVNVPIAAALIPAALLRLRTGNRPRRTALDLAGVLLFSAGLFGVLYGLLQASVVGWLAAASAGSILLGLVLLGFFLVAEHRAPDPVLPPRMFGNAGFRMSIVTALLSTAGVFGVVFILTQYLRIVLGYEPLRAGLATLPWTLAPLLSAPVAGIIASRTGMRPLLIAGAALQAVALGWFALVIGPDVSYPALLPGLIAAGLGMGFFFALITGQAIAFVAPADEGTASGLGNSAREVGVLVGVAMTASVFSWAGGDTTAHGFIAGTPAALFFGAGVMVAALVAAVATPADPVRALAAPGHRA
nr:MFS transporter [Micromonospora sp. DSM 115978]